MKIAKLQNISQNIAAQHSVPETIAETLEGESGTSWIKYLGWLSDVAKDNLPRFSIFAKAGNIKLPFLSFSSLPGLGHCPGAGDCLNFCYSFKAQRYPSAYGRQAQNSLLLQTSEGREHILAALDEFEPENGEKIDFRLYVDGDFDSLSTLDFWVKALLARPWLRAYGYSKSFELFLNYGRGAFGPWPTNYKLNLSSGHKYDQKTVEAMRTLPIVRGEFVAVLVDFKVKTADHGTKAHNQKLRTAYGKKSFTCPGKCGTCTPSGHACGLDSFKGVDIIIAAH